MKRKPDDPPAAPLSSRDGFGHGANRRRWFRVVALALPVVLLLLVELGLRLAGYGYPTSFFLEVEQDGEKVLIENPKFGWRFFPPALARAPQAMVLEAKKTMGTVRIFILGESAALGDPEPAYGFGRQLQRLLEARHPATRIQVINVAMTAINSHVIREIARDCAPREGDLWLLYAGNNEVVGPFGAGTVFGRQAPSLGFVRAALTLKRLRLGQLLSNLRPHSAEPRQWEGMELFLNNQVAADDRRLKRVYQNFSANLSAVIRQGISAGAKVVVSTVAVNLKDCPPFGSTHRVGLTADERQRWQDLFERGRTAESERRYTEALAAYQQAGQIDSQFAELAFRRATCELASNQAPAAQADFSRARDLDTLRFRADSSLNGIIREAARAEHVPLVDAEQECTKGSASGWSDDNEFYDHVHLNFHGNYRVATLLAAEAEKALFPSTSPAGPMLPETEVAHRLAYTGFDRHRVGEEMRARLRQPPFSGQSNFAERDQQWGRTLAGLQAQASDAVWEYRAALAVAPADWVLRQNFARVLEAADDKQGAIEQWIQVVDELPDEPEGYFHLGNLALDRGAFAEASSRFERALELRPNSTEALNGLGLALRAQGRTNEAFARFNAALSLNPGYSAARVNQALLQADSGDIPGAIAQYRAVLRTDTNEVAARINLARLLAAQGNKAEAVTLYTEALALRPDNPIAQFDLGNALAAQDRHADALAHYAAAVQYRPAFTDAQYNLALELARAGRIDEALPHFSEAVRLSPSSAEFHFNYGVALAKLKQYDQAATQFEQTLRLQPSHSAAQAMLERARQLGATNPLGPVTN